jgi:probable rRNA maturation factor
MVLDINNLTKFPVDSKSFTQVAKKVLSGENRETENISLVFVGKEEIKKLNKKFREKDGPTDVLSFNLNDKECLGEIVICPDVVMENAEKYGVSANYEMMNVFIHGILHLLGYDHENSEKEAEIMEAKQDKYLKESNIK